MKLKNLFLASMALFAFTACTDTPDSPYDFPVNGGNGGTTEEGVYINETFTSEFGVFTPVETVGDTPWIIDYKTAKATSYVDGTNKAATSWLISSPVDFTEETEAYVAFEYIIRYSESGKVAANHQLLISADYTGDPAAATWTDLPYGAVEGADWVTFYKANVAVPAEYLGKSGIVFALRYTATTKASTWEVKNFKVAHGTADAPEEPEEAKEYTVAEALEAFTGVATPAVVKGYIVGTVDGQVYAEGCRFSGTAESKTNILIADNADETDPANCMPVQLPSGAVRNALNLVDNAGNYKKQVTLTGSLEKYFGVPGLKTVSKYEIEGVTPEEPETPEGAYISETFATSFGAFTTQETVGNYPWIIDYSTAKATSYVDTDGDGKADANKEATSWLISPTIDLTNETEAYIAFEYIIRYAESGKVADNHQLLICSDYSGDVATASWVNIPYGAVEGVDWNTFYKANVAVPADFLGKSTVTFALRYTATTKAGTWEVKNFVVAHGAATGETPDTPDTPVVPSVENMLTNGSFEDWDGSSPVAWGTGNIGHNATILQSDDARTGGYSVIVKGDANNNKRLATKSYVLAPGTYTFSVYLKANGAEAGQCRLGYVPIVDGVAGQYKYEGPAASTVTEEWAPRVYEFTLTEQTEVAFVVMNNKAGNGASFLVDDASLTTTDGSISGGGNEEGGEEGSDEPETPAETSSIADVLAAGAGNAKVEGTVIATYTRGFIVNDGTASILVYLGADKGYTKGDVVTVEGTTSMYAGLLQFGNTATVTKTGTATVNEGSATAWTGADMDAYLNSPSIKYVEYTGTLNISGNYYNVTVEGAINATGSISYPADGFVDASLNGKEITVKGYVIGVSSSKYVNTMATSVTAAN